MFDAAAFDWCAAKDDWGFFWERVGFLLRFRWIGCSTPQHSIGPQGTEGRNSLGLPAHAILTRPSSALPLSPNTSLQAASPAISSRPPASSTFHRYSLPPYSPPPSPGAAAPPAPSTCATSLSCPPSARAKCGGQPSCCRVCQTESTCCPSIPGLCWEEGAQVRLVRAWMG